MATAIVLDHVSKIYAPSTLALDRISLEVSEGEFVCVLGPSGCGKSTTLRVIAGFVHPDDGEVWIGGRNMSVVPPNRRNIGMVYQQYALFPHLSVFDNVAFGLRMRRVSPSETRERVCEALELVNLGGLGDRKPGQLSGGQQQRVAVARAVAIRPAVMLLDEPLSNVDAKLRAEMQVELKELQRTLGITTIYVTHAQDEALSLGDRVVVMSRGRIVQIGRPKDIYFSPVDRFVAGFIGRANFLDGTIVTHPSRADRWRFRADTGECLEIRRQEQDVAERRCSVFIRPESIRVSRSSPQPGLGNSLDATIEDVFFTGVSTLLSVCAVTGRRLVAEVREVEMGFSGELTRGDKVTLELPAECVKVLVD